MPENKFRTEFESISPEHYPKHIAIIPNGHRTWAKMHGKTPTEAHRIGMEKLVDLSRYIKTLGIHTVSVWAMSTENYKKRAEEEVTGLMSLLKYAFTRWAQELFEDGTRIIHLGRKDRLPNDLVKIITDWELKSLNNTEFCANLCFDYGGQDEILRAMGKAFADIEAGKITLEDLSDEEGLYEGKYPYYRFKDYLDTGDQPHPYPDLIIRTNSELRLSGFMPWQSVYSEIYATPELMPDCTNETLQKALVDYSKRKRTFGGDLG